MPLCPQITNTPITVVQNADFTVSSVLPVVAATTTQLAATNASVAAANAAAAAAAAAAAVAAADAAAAQAAASAALATAGTAYTAAIGSLQPSANTIVNASNQITGINGNGITVYSGSSATTGARVVLNSTGLAGFGSVNITNVVPNGSTVTYTASGHSFRVSQSVTISGLAPAGYNGTFTITSLVAGSTFTVSNSTTATVTDANGIADFATIAISASTGTVNVSGGIITSSTITGGSLNIAGNAIIDSNGLLTATGATITGTVNATAGYFGNASNGFSISSTGLVGVGTGTIIGGLIATSGGADAVVLDGTNNALGIKYGGTFAGWLLGIGAGSFMMHYGNTPNIASGYPRVQVSSTTSSLAANTSNSLSITTSGNNMVGAMRFFNGVQVDGLFTTGGSVVLGSTTGSQFEYFGSSGNVRVAQTYNNNMGGTTRAMRVSTAGLYGYVSSTQRRKEQIENYGIDSQALLNLQVKKFKYKNDESNVQQYGFIAEEAQELGLDELIQYDSTGIPDYFAYETLPIFLLQLIQELKAEIDQLKGE
jgi:hypothetical protein